MQTKRLYKSNDKKLDGVCDILTANGMTGLVVEEEGDF